MRPNPLLVTALLAASVAGCSWAGEVQELSDGTQVLVSGPRGGGMDALITGRLQSVDGCLGVRGQVVVWAHGTEVVEGEDAITLPAGERVGLGDEIELGGGSASSEDLGSPAPEVPQECRGAGEVWVASE